MAQVRISTYSLLGTGPGGSAYWTIVNGENAIKATTKFMFPYVAQKNNLSLSSTDSNYAYGNKNLVFVAIETDFVIENMDLLQGNVSTNTDTTFVFCLNLKMRFLVMRN